MQKFKEPNVDETLFGTKTSKRLSSAGQRTLTSNNRPDVIIMSREEIATLRDRSKLITQEEIERRKRELYLSQKEMHDRADLRKTKMKELEVEAKNHVPSIEMELEAIEAANPVLQKVYRAQDSEADDVKTLKARLNRMKVETIMAKQIKEKEEIANYDGAIDKAWDDEMEERRLDEIQRYRQFLEHRQIKNAEFKVKIEGQLAERELERILEKERVEMEGELMLEKIRQDQIDAQNRQIVREAAQKKRAKQIEDANIMQMSHRLDRAEHERQEDIKLVEYNKLQDRKANQEKHRKEREAKQRALECERLRAKQERSQDQQAAADERRALEYQRVLEKKERMDEENKKIAYDKMMSQVMLERKMQTAYKQKVAEERKVDEEKERQKIIAEQKIQVERDRKANEQRRIINEVYSRDLKDQFLAVEDNKRQEELNRLIDAEQEERGRQIQYLRERRLIEQQLRDHIAAGYKPPPIRSGVVGDVLHTILKETKEKC